MFFVPRYKQRILYFHVLIFLNYASFTSHEAIMQLNNDYCCLLSIIMGDGRDNSRYRSGSKRELVFRSSARCFCPPSSKRICRQILTKFCTINPSLQPVQGDEPLHAG